MKTILISQQQSVAHSKSSLLGGIGQITCRGLKHIKLLGLVAALMTFGAHQLQASDPVGIFALIDKVVLEPNESSPERIQIWGTFAMAEGRRGGEYESPKSGYLYYKLPVEKGDVARKEWADLKSIAGKREIIGFGTRYAEKGKVRKADAKAADPDIYPVGWGLTKMKERSSDYPPIKQLLATIPAKDTKK